MIEGRSILALIPARGGSKGIPGKNLIDLAGRPLIGWTISAAAESRYIDRVVLSSDDQQIIDVAVSLGCEAPFVRPDALAQDDTAAMAVVEHALDQLEAYDLVVLLQPTSPLRTAEDIDAAIETLAARSAPAVVSVTRSGKPPEWLYYLQENGGLKPLLASDVPVTQRQASEPVYYLNGAVYVAETAWLREQGTFVSAETIAYEMPPEKSIDIDEPSDLVRARHALAV